MMDSHQHWIFLRGLSREKAHWDSFPSLFENHLNARIHCLDLPGTGTNFSQSSPSTIPEIVDQLIAQSGNISQRRWILAHSMGCLAAIDWMRREPHRFYGAVLLNSSVQGFSPIFSRLRSWGVWKFIQFLLSKKNSRKREEIKYQLTCNHPDKSEETILKWMNIQRERPVSFHTMLNQVRAAAFFKPSRPEHPILVLNSLGDRLVDASCSESIARNWKLPLRTHLWAGHDIAHDDPDWIIIQIRSWLEKTAENQ